MNEPQRHMPQLDGLRAIAIGAVLFGHLAEAVPLAAPAGVRLFFVLSGYLITGILLDGRAHREVGEVRSLANFYVRRALRLWPAYYLICGVAILFDLQGIRSVAAWHLFYASNILFALRNAWVPWMAAPWWSLAVEEQFYLVWPLVVFLVPARRLPLVAAAAIPIAIVTRALLPVDGLAFYVFTSSSFDALAGGALLAMAERRGGVPLWVPWLAPASAAVILPVLLLADAAAMNIAQALTVPLFVGVVAFAARGTRGAIGSLLETRPLLYLGKISYGLYLYHAVVMAAVMRVAGRHVPALAGQGWTMLAVAGCVTLLVAVVSWHALEAPMNRLKRRFPYP